MQFEAKGRTSDPAHTLLVQEQGQSLPMVDVSFLAARLSITAVVLMEAEAFGVLVTRRPGVKVSELTRYEESRLLDVLVHMKESLIRCDGEGCEFSLWAIPSDCCDSRARVHWMELIKDGDGACRLALSDA